jgi:hypothetical protein
VFFGARSDPELKAAQAQKSELSRDELREFLTEVILTRAGKDAVCDFVEQRIVSIRRDLVFTVFAAISS